MKIVVFGSCIPNGVISNLYIDKSKSIGGG